MKTAKVNASDNCSTMQCMTETPGLKQAMAMQTFVLSSDTSDDSPLFYNRKIEREPRAQPYCLSWGACSRLSLRSVNTTMLLSWKCRCITRVHRHVSWSMGMYTCYSA